MSEQDVVHIGDIDVDSGSIIITDPCYWHECGMHEDAIDALNPGWKPVNTAEIPHDAGHMGKAVASRTGLGDGTYPVYATFEDVPGWGRRVAKLEIFFLADPYDDDDPNED